MSKRTHDRRRVSEREASGQWNTGARDLSANGQAPMGSMNRPSLGDNLCVFDGPVTARSALTIQVDRKTNTTVLVSYLVLSTKKVPTRTRELPRNVVATCENTKQRNDGQAKTEQCIRIEKNKIVIESQTQFKDPQAGSDYSLEDKGTCRNVCQMRMAFGTSSIEGALNVASSVLISVNATGRVDVNETTQFCIGDAEERSALVPLKPSDLDSPLSFRENVRVGRSTIEITRGGYVDLQLINSLKNRIKDSSFKEERVYAPLKIGRPMPCPARRPGATSDSRSGAPERSSDHNADDFYDSDEDRRMASQLVSGQPTQATQSRTGNSAYELNYIFDLPDMWRNTASQNYEHCRLITLRMASNDGPLTIHGQGNINRDIYHTFNMPDVNLPGAASQPHEHRRLIKLHLVSNGKPLNIYLHGMFRTRKPDFDLDHAFDIDIDYFEFGD